jgi:SAM-dependent methyltransferase
MVRSIAEDYPPSLRAGQLRDAERIAFHLGLLPETVGSVCDVGGGIGMFSIAAARSGRKAYLVDDFNDPVNRIGESILDLHRRAGVEVIQRDVPNDGIGLPGSVDAITFFETIEHWHNSPRRALHEAVESLTPGGVIIVSLPNCVDLTKRILTPLGRARWSSFEDWYHEERFRSHVREAALPDMKAIAKDLKLSRYRLFGRNWELRKRLGATVDLILRPMVSFCSDLYLIGTT